MGLTEESGLRGEDWLRTGTDQDVVKKVEYLNCLQEGQLALGSSLRTLGAR